jgi:hypothetical protein
MFGKSNCEPVLPATQFTREGKVLCFDAFDIQPILNRLKIRWRALNIFQEPAADNSNSFFHG